jgi:hypothetical protein
MEPNEQVPPTGDEPAEPLRRLEERIERVTEAAERMISDAAGRRPPAAGWEPPKEGGAPARSFPELEALVAAIAPLRELIPADAMERLQAAIKELLLAIRALIDYYLERIERRPPKPPEVEDIPID